MECHPESEGGGVVHLEDTELDHRTKNSEGFRIIFSNLLPSLCLFVELLPSIVKDSTYSKYFTLD